MTGKHRDWETGFPGDYIVTRKLRDWETCFPHDIVTGTPFPSHEVFPSHDTPEALERMRKQSIQEMNDKQLKLPKVEETILKSKFKQLQERLKL